MDEMMNDMAPVTASDVVEWFRDASRKKDGKIPSTDSAYVIQIVDIVSHYKNEIGREYTTEEVLNLEMFKLKFKEVTNLISKIDVQLDQLRVYSVKQFDEGDFFIKIIDDLKKAINNKWIDNGFSADAFSPPLWYLWTRDLREQIVFAWRQAGHDYSSNNANNPTMRVLRKALASIDGSERDEKAIEQAVRRWDKAYFPSRTTKPKRSA